MNDNAKVFSLVERNDDRHLELSDDGGGRRVHRNA